MKFDSCQNDTRFNAAEIDALRDELISIRDDVLAYAAKRQSLLQPVHPRYQDSAHNLLHYLALRRHDLRPLQLRLAALGLSSLGRAESHVLATLDAVLEVLCRLSQRQNSSVTQGSGQVDFVRGQQLLVEHTDQLLGSPARERSVRIMVTMPGEAADDYTLVRNLVSCGMDCARINCAHDDLGTWQRVIDHLRRAEAELGRSCRLVMDLAGPKLRTGPIVPRPAVEHVRPRRDRYGRVVASARIWLSAKELAQAAPSPADATLPVPGEWLQRLHHGDRLHITDARGARRKLKIVDVTAVGCWAEAKKSLYVTPGLVLQHRHGNGKVGDFPPSENAIELVIGDHLVLTRDLAPGRPATTDRSGQVLTSAMIGCTIGEVFDDVRPNESIWFDDGKIGGVIERVEHDRLLIRITQASPDGAKLRADRGINLPQSRLRLPALTADDLTDLSFVAEHADVVELSFAGGAADVEQLEEELRRRDSRLPAIVLKIETRRGFEKLPEMLLAAMRWPCCGVMIARGDLAVECGFERLAEVQEEILWICEAAHVPVIWATQVLETLAKQGMPSRAEITDAAMGHRAECVMLNKGRHVLAAVQVLDDILRRMQAHQDKKRTMLRELRLAHALQA
ncbi:MAG TPA: pyruvate kinase [Pirellulales bacterium]|nr:pyruvate kinase [Pirellulales bacterium]